MPAEMLPELATHGVLGLVAAIFIGLFVWKDRQLEKERAARVDDSKAYMQLAIGLQAQHLDSAHKMADILEELREQRRIRR